MFLVSACGLTSAPSTEDEASGFTLTWGKETDPAGTNPLKVGDVHAWEILSLVYEPLTRPNKDLTIGPGLAAAWKQNSDTEWSITLRDGVKFSNGRALTSEDVVATWEAYKKTGILLSLFPNFDTMTAADPRTVDIKLKAPMPDLPNRLEIFWVLPGKEMKDGSFNPDKDLLGTGPYVSGKHTKGVSWTFTANPHYWRKGLPRAKRVDIKFIPDDASRLAAVRTGEVDYAITANPDVQKILAGDPRVKPHVQQTTDMYFMLLNPNWEKSKVRDKRVRQAIALAIDRKQVVATALGGIGQDTAVTPRGLPGACDPNGVLGTTGRDVDKAKALLKEAGVSDLSFRLTVVPAFGALRAPQIAQVIQQNLSDIGIRMDVSVLDAGAWLEEVRAGELDATINWYTGGGTISQILGYMDPKNGSLMLKNYAQDADHVAKIRKALLTPEGPERTSAFAEACDSLNELATFLPLMTKPTVMVYRTDRIAPVLAPVEPNQMTFRSLAEFSKAS
jgi:peptide/nickel transport system substrate-binding protein